MLAARTISILRLIMELATKLRGSPILLIFIYYFILFLQQYEAFNRPTAA